MRNGFGGLVANLGWLIGGVNYLATAFHFFSTDRVGLGLVQLAVPPAELVLPWVAGAAFGVASLVSFALILIGGAIATS